LNFHRLAFGTGLWETAGVKKPELVVTAQGKGLRGKCSSCSESAFKVDVPEDTPDYRNDLQRSFTVHLKLVHMHEDASQAAERIVRDATS
jgi:hypothetical protein